MYEMGLAFGYGFIEEVVFSDGSGLGSPAFGYGKGVQSSYLSSFELLLLLS